MSRSGGTGINSRFGDLRPGCRSEPARVSHHNFHPALKEFPGHAEGVVLGSGTASIHQQIMESPANECNRLKEL